MQIIQPSAATESVNVLGQQIAFSNPRGYCTPGTSVREVELMDLARRSLGEGSRLVHAAVRCSELEDYRKGRRDMLDHWLQIQLIGPRGSFHGFAILLCSCKPVRQSFPAACSQVVEM